MSFQIKNFKSIAASMLNIIRSLKPEITDLSKGSVVRTLVEAPATEIEESYLQTFNGLKDASLTSTYTSFDFKQESATFAAGYVRIDMVNSLFEDIFIPVNTAFFSTDGRKYYSTSDITWSKDLLYTIIPVISDTPGDKGNIIGGMVATSPLFETGYKLAFLNVGGGREQESLDEMQSRFKEYIYALSRGVLEAIVFGAKTAKITGLGGDVTDYVVRAGATEVPGYVRVFIYSNKGIPSESLVKEAQKIIDGWTEPDGEKKPGYRAGGVRASITSMNEVAVNFYAEIEMFDGYTLNNDIESKIKYSLSRDLFNTQPGGIAIINSLIASMMEIKGIKKIIPKDPENILCGQSDVLLLGDFKLSVK